MMRAWMGLMVRLIVALGLMVGVARAQDVKITKTLDNLTVALSVMKVAPGQAPSFGGHTMSHGASSKNYHVEVLLKDEAAKEVTGARIMARFKSPHGEEKNVLSAEEKRADVYSNMFDLEANTSYTLDLIIRMGNVEKKVQMEFELKGK